MLTEVDVTISFCPYSDFNYGLE